MVSLGKELKSNFKQGMKDAANTLLVPTRALKALGRTPPVNKGAEAGKELWNRAKNSVDAFKTPSKNYKSVNAKKRMK